MRVLVTGATGFVGRNVAAALDARGDEVVAMTRRPEAYEGPGRAVGGDVGDAASLRRALEGVDTACYLVHSLDHTDFSERDRHGAEAFAAAAVAEGVRHVVYLGGLGEDRDDLSEHLRSRREVEHVLLDGCPATAVRAGIVVGDGGISWEILRQLVQRLPVMLTPRWVQTRCQPIGLGDVVRYFELLLGMEAAVGRVVEVGCPEALTYRRMLHEVSRLVHRPTLIVPVPLLTPALSSRWLRLITDVDLSTARALVESLGNEVVLHGHVAEELTGHRPASFQDAAKAALEARRLRLEREQRAA